jgi:hypothetical protein
MASNMTREQLDMIKAVWNDPVQGWHYPNTFIALMKQYGVTLNDLMVAIGQNVGYIANYFYGTGAVPNGWGGLPTKKGWYMDNLASYGALTNPTQIELNELAAYRAVASNNALSPVYYVDVPTGPEDPSYHRDAGAQQASVNTWGGGTTSTPYAPAPVTPQPVYVPTPDQIVLQPAIKRDTTAAPGNTGIVPPKVLPHVLTGSQYNATGEKSGTSGLTIMAVIAAIGFLS